MKDSHKDEKGIRGIDHTRWEAHVELLVVNAHLHSCDDVNVIAVHNGIVENYQELREKLVKSEYEFKFQTDTKVAVKSCGIRLMAVTMAGNYFTEDRVEIIAYVLRVNKFFVVSLQLIGYYVTIAKGFDVDKPGNLAKSVMVE